MLGYGGGLISGDAIELNISVKANAKLLITSQSTSKAFKAVSGRDPTFVKTRAKVSKGGLLVLVPQPMQCFRDSVLTQDTAVTLEGGGGGEGEEDPSLLLVDWYTGGRENLDGLWQLNSFHTNTSISYSSQEEDGEECVDSDPSHGHIDKDGNRSSDPKLVFRDATRLSGGKDLLRHMRDYNIVCCCVLIGPKVEQVSSVFLKNYSSRHTYDEKESFGPSTNMDYNQGEGLNRRDEGLLVSCGTFNTCQEGNHQEGVVVRLAASTLEIAGTSFSYISL